MTEKQPGALYVVATPMGNLADISARALTVLREVDLIAAEDTRHTRKLLTHYAIDNPMLALHEHNEADKAGALLQQCLQGKQVALVSDAGTPLISDPGQELIQQAHACGVKLVPVPGACAAIAALSVSGLSAERFVFEGFLPARSARRQKRLTQLATETRTMIFYEAVHRMPLFLQELAAAFGAERVATVARELTKHFETITRASVVDLQQYFENHADQLRGEFVVLVAGAAAQSEAPPLEPRTLLKHLLTELPPAKAAAIAAKLLDQNKKSLYALAMELQNK